MLLTRIVPYRPVVTSSSARDIGTKKRKTPKQDKKATTSKKSKPLIKKSPKTVSSEKGGSAARVIFAATDHNVPNVIHEFNPDIRHKIYGKLCYSVLKNYGFHLETQSVQKGGLSFNGQWYLPYSTVNVQGCCSLFQHVNKDKMIGQSKLDKEVESNTINLFINNVGYKTSIIKKFVNSQTPSILMSIFDGTPNWLVKPELSFSDKSVLIEKCLHKQLWDQQLGFTNFKFRNDIVECPEISLNRGMSLLLFNRALIKQHPLLSAGRFIYKWPKETHSKNSLKTHYFSTILCEDDSGKKNDLSDVLIEKRKSQERYNLSQQIGNINDRIDKPLRIQDVLEYNYSCITDHSSEGSRKHVTGLSDPDLFSFYEYENLEHTLTGYGNG